MTKSANTTGTIREGTESRKIHKPGDLPKIILEVAFGGKDSLILYVIYSLPVQVRDFIF